MHSDRLPGHPHIAYVGDELFVEQTPLSALAQQYGTPKFVYSRA
jgi:diaminopimelate decarboxylase